MLFYSSIISSSKSLLLSLKPVSSMKESPNDPILADRFPCIPPHYIHWLENDHHGCSYGSQQPLTELLASPPSSKRVKSSSETQDRWCHACAQTMPLVPNTLRARSNPHTSPSHKCPTHHHVCAIHTQCWKWTPTSPLPHYAQLQEILHFSLEQARHTPTLGPSPFPLHEGFLPILFIWLLLTSDLLVSWRTALKSFMCAD